MSRPTHFLCLPLVNSASLPQLQTSFSRFSKDKAFRSDDIPIRQAKRPSHLFKRKTSSDSESDDNNAGQSANASMREGCIPAKAVRPIGTLHLTLGVMNLTTIERVDAVTSFLRSIDLRTLLAKSTQHSEPERNGESSHETQADQSTMLVQLKGLHALQQPHKARVLYAEPCDASNRLLPFCIGIRNAFKNAAFIIEEDRELKLHATIINTIYVPKGRQGNKSRRLEFDATDLIDRWKDEVWAEVSISKVVICEMGAKEDQDGKVKYTEIASVEF